MDFREFTFHALVCIRAHKEVLEGNAQLSALVVSPLGIRTVIRPAAEELDQLLCNQVRRFLRQPVAVLRQVFNFLGSEALRYRRRHVNIVALER